MVGVAKKPEKPKKPEPFLFRILKKQRYADKPTKETKVSRPMISQGDDVSRSMLGEIMRNFVRNLNK